MRQGPSRPATREAVARQYPRAVAHLIASSLGYACPSVAAAIVLDAIRGQENWCEWVYSCYGGDPRKALAQAIAGRHGHKGFMASYRQAKALVDRYNATREEPLFASWF